MLTSSPRRLNGGVRRLSPRETALTAELGTILGLSIAVVLSVIGVTWRMGRVERRLLGVEHSVERLHVDMNRLRDDIDGLRKDVKALLLRLPAKDQ